MTKTIYELQQERGAQQSRILHGIMDAYAEARGLKLTEGPYLDELTPGQRTSRELRERADASRAAWEVGKEEWLKVEGDYAAKALERVEELRESLFGQARQAPMEARVALSSMSEDQLQRSLEQAAESNDGALAWLVFLVAHTRDLVELRIKFYEEFDEDEEIVALYTELDEAPSEEELERIQEEASHRFERIAPPVPRPNEMTANFYG